MKGYEKVAEIMFAHNEFDAFTANEIFSVLRGADDQYYNGDGNSFLTDSQYDALRLFAQRTYPHHVYFTGVGSEVRGGKVKLPYQMGSLDQVEIGEIADWVGNWTLQDQDLIITDKLDGTSAMVIYDDSGDLQIAYSRGNGIEGADITRHIKHFVPLNIGRPAVIRGEVIIPIDNFDAVKAIAKSRNGNEYKNIRNAVAGLMNAKTNNKDVYQHVDFVAYEILGCQGIDKVNMLQDLKDAGFKIPYWESFKGCELTDHMLAQYLNGRRSVAEYEIDGIVIDVNLAAKREQMNPTRDTLNPAFSVKYKVADASNLVQAKVLGVEWNISKHGYLKPRINIEPVELVGATVQYCTGFNAKFIQTNGIGKGAIIEITRSGDVIPYCKSVVQPATPDMPDVDYTWTVNDQGDNVDIVMVDHHNDDQVKINRMVDFFTSIDAPYLKKGNIEKLFNASHDRLQSIEAVITASQGILEAHLGANGTKAYHGLRKALTDIPLWKLMGSTHFFGRGIGKRKMKKLIDALGYEKVMVGTSTEFASVEGFDEKTALKVSLGMGEFIEWLEPLETDGYIVVKYDSDDNAGGRLSGEKIVFTGFRDKHLQELAEANGATMQSSVSGKTTIVVGANPNNNSGKLKKARDLGVRVVSIDEFKEMI